MEVIVDVVDLAQPLGSLDCFDLICFPFFVTKAVVFVVPIDIDVRVVSLFLWQNISMKEGPRL